MCLQNNQFKLCSCKIDEENLPHHYWVLYRFSEGKNLHIIGEAFLPYGFDEDIEKTASQILNRIKEPDAFDFEPDFLEKDCLTVHLQCEENQEHQSFQFEYKNGNWHSAEYDAFDLMNCFEEMREGKIIY